MLDRYPQFWSDAFDFQGRIRRIDYWTIVLLNLVIGFAAQSDERLHRLGVRRGFDRALLLDADSPHSRYGKGMALDLHQPGALDRTVMAVVDFDRTFR